MAAETVASGQIFALTIMCIFITVEALRPAPDDLLISFPECTSTCQWFDHTKILNCSKAGCRDVPAVAGTRAAGVRDMYMDENHISQISLLKLHNVVRLDLSHNNISQIEPKAFQRMQKLEILLLSYNKLDSIEHDHFNGLVKLRQLKLNGNRLSSLPPSVFYSTMYQTLKHLDLSANQLEHLDHNAITDLKALTYLSLAQNRLRSLDPQHFAGLYALNILDLAYNPLGILKNGGFKSLHNLTRLALQWTEVATIQPGAFAGLRSLRDLFLQENQITDVGSSLNIRDLRQLQYLYLDNNPFLTLQAGGFPLGLQVLSIKRCSKLETVEPWAFGGLDQLTKLDLSNNPRLYYIAPNAFDTETNVRELVLAHNALRSLGEGFVDWHQLRTLDLQGNPWRCDCRIEWMRQTPLPGDAKDHVVCVRPKYLSGRKIESLDFPDLICHRYISVHSRVALGLIALATTCLFVSLACLCYRWRRQLFPCCMVASAKYVALFNVTDGEDDSVTICPEKKHRTSIVRQSNGSLPMPVDV